MINFLFWNIYKKPLQRNIRNLALARDLDIIILVECKIPVNDMLDALDGKYHSTFTNCDKIAIYTKFSRDFITPLSESGRYTIRRISLPGIPYLTLATVHLPSKMYGNVEDQIEECRQLSTQIQQVEQSEGHKRTLLVGDFNMNPFEIGLVSAAGFHGVMAQAIATKNSRTIQDRQYPYFYNPMWKHFGERGKPFYGTYYYGTSGQVTYFWNIFDQVLLRPDLLQHFKDEDLEILSTDNTSSFITNDGIPNKETFSDHLPIYFKLSI